MTATMLSRRERHEVEIEFEVSDKPVIADKDALATKRPITPTKVRMTLRKRVDGTWGPRATVYGSQQHSLMNGWANYYDREADGLEWWPAWLRELAVEHMPSGDTGQEARDA